jgi:3-oxoacyl-[acyl-carrier-protein] synthase-3
MIIDFSNKCISGISVVVPENARSFLDDMKNFDFPEKRSIQLKEVMGYDSHRIVEEGSTSSDLVIFAMRNLFDTGSLKIDDFQAMIVVTQSPDYFLPQTSSVIHGELGLGKDIICVDLAQGCAGYVMGLIQAFMMLNTPGINKVVLANVDVLSLKVSPRDRNSFPLVGDAASITIIENSTSENIFASINFAGQDRSALMIPAGGFAKPSTPETAILHDAGDGNHRALDNLVMDGAAVFNFVQREVPPMIEALLAESGVAKEDVHGFAFHQPNRFMLEKLAEKMDVPVSKMPNNVVGAYGNSSGVTIPTALAMNYANDLVGEKELTYCLAGFGVGLTWASIVIKIGNLDFCKIIEYPNKQKDQFSQP